MEHLTALADIGARVHAAAFGFSELDHVLNPLRLMHADAFFLLEREDDLAYEHHRKRGVDVHDRLNETGVPWERVVTDLWDPAAVGASLTEIIPRHDLQRLLVNVSVGPNPVAVGATLASLFSPIRLYHPAGPRPWMPLQRIADVAYLPTFRVADWTSAHVAILHVLGELDEPAPGGQVKDALRARHPAVIGDGGGGDNWAQVEHARFQPLVEFLERVGAVQVTRAKRRWTLRLTESGKQMAKLLANMTKPPGPGRD